MSRRLPDLKSLARAFAGDLTELLNHTVTDGVRLRSFIDRRGRAVVGYQVSETNPLGESVPLTVSRAPASLCLSILHSLTLDDSGAFLTTDRSNYTLEAAKNQAPIFTYDFVRNPPNDFPEAHIHIHGESDVLRAMLVAGDRRKDKPSDLHLPVGGRRFRPCLEDIIEFCILERLVTPRKGWKEALNRSRDKYYDQQLRSAVRRNPAAAVEVLDRDD